MTSLYHNAEAYILIEGSVLSIGHYHYVKVVIFQSKDGTHHR